MSYTAVSSIVQGMVAKYISRFYSSSQDKCCTSYIQTLLSFLNKSPFQIQRYLSHSHPGFLLVCVFLGFGLFVVGFFQQKKNRGGCLFLRCHLKCNTILLTYFYVILFLSQYTLKTMTQESYLHFISRKPVCSLSKIAEQAYGGGNGEVLGKH